MPIYEYLCHNCQDKVSFLVRSFSPPSDPICPHCGGADLSRLISTVAYHRQDADRLAEFDSSKHYGEDFYKDSRNVGLWAKKRAKEMGIDMGPALDEIVEKGRSGELLKDSL